MVEQTKTVISFNKPTPQWATWTFRAVYVLSIALSFWVGGTKLIKEDNKLEIILGLRAVDGIVWGLGRGLGVDKKQFED